MSKENALHRLIFSSKIYNSTLKEKKIKSTSKIEIETTLEALKLEIISFKVNLPYLVTLLILEISSLGDQSHKRMEQRIS